MIEVVEDRGGARPFLWVACGFVSLGLYLAMAGSISRAEVVAGVASSLLTTVAVINSGNAEDLGRMRPSWWFLLLRRLPGRVVTDTARVVGAVLTGRNLSGRFHEVPFDPGGDDPISGSRRALVKAAASLAPNSYVVIMDRERHRMLTHQLIPSDETPGHGDRQWPV